MTRDPGIDIRTDGHRWRQCEFCDGLKRDPMDGSPCVWCDAEGGHWEDTLTGGNEEQAA